MTHDEQLREWDARIAVAFFGWHWVTLRGFSVPRLLRADGTEGEFPRFTTDPAAATMLWDKIREISIVSDVSACADGFVFDITFGHQQWVSANANTWPLALCKAALAMAEAKGATV